MKNLINLFLFSIVLALLFGFSSLPEKGVLQAESPLPQAEDMKIISFNIGMGARQKSSNKNYFMKLNDRKPHLISFIKNEVITNPDEKVVICLQEVDFNMKRSLNENFMLELQRDLGSEWNYYYFDPSKEDDPRYGIAIITNMEGTLDGGKAKMQTWNIFNSSTIENRGAIAVKLKFEGHPIWVVNTHLGFDNPVSQIDNILNRVYTFDPGVPVAICGDFNVADTDYQYGDLKKNHSLYMQTIGRLESNGFYKSQITTGVPQTWHSWNVTKRGAVLDYIFTSYPYPPSVINVLKPFEKVECLVPAYLVGTNRYYASDHNALKMSYSFSAQ